MLARLLNLLENDGVSIRPLRGERGAVARRARRVDLSVGGSRNVAGDLVRTSAVRGPRVGGAFRVGRELKREAGLGGFDLRTPEAGQAVLWGKGERETPREKGEVERKRDRKRDTGMEKREGETEREKQVFAKFKK